MAFIMSGSFLIYIYIYQLISAFTTNNVLMAFNRLLVID